jgi:hypothetical protein
MAGSFFLLASALDLVYAVGKSLLFGAAIGVIACYYGLNPPGNSINAVPKAAISAVTQATLAVMLLNVIFAYLVYGSALFGLFTAPEARPPTWRREMTACRGHEPRDPPLVAPGGSHVIAVGSSNSCLSRARTQAAQGCAGVILRAESTGCRPRRAPGCALMPFLPATAG